MPVQNTKQHKLSVDNDKWRDWRHILELNGLRIEVELLDRAHNNRTCHNVFKRCKKLLDGKQEFFCGGSCRSGFHDRIKELKTKDINHKRGQELLKERDVWIKAHPDAYRYMLTFTRHLFKCSAMRIQPSYILNDTRLHQCITINNSISPLLMDKIIEDLKKENINVADIIERRQRKLET